jgi:hypothetical protein
MYLFVFGEGHGGGFEEMSTSPLGDLSPIDNVFGEISGCTKGRGLACLSVDAVVEMTYWSGWSSTLIV